MAWQPAGKGVLISGASSGVGRELALRLASQGANVALLARRKPLLEQVAKECAVHGVVAVPIQCDVADRESCRCAVATAVQRLEKLDVVILGAGVSMACFFEDIQDLADADEMIKVNIMGQVNVLHYALPAVPKSNESRIVVISAMAGCAGTPFRTLYCATKWGLNGFCSSLRSELKDAYGESSPQVMVTCPPELATELKVLDFGAGAKASLKEAKADAATASTPCSAKPPVNAVPAANAADMILKGIIQGKRSHYFKYSEAILASLYGLCPESIDKLVVKAVRRNYAHPRFTADSPTSQSSPSSGPWSAKGRNVLITGASAGIGKELAVRYAKEGANVALLARRLPLLEELAATCRSFGVKAVPVLCDVTDRKSCQAAVAEAIKQLEHLDVLILNAGMSMGCYFEDIKDLSDGDYMMNLNIMGQVNILHYALPAVPKTRDSRIVAISSVAGVVGVPFRTLYCCSKWGLSGFCWALRTELLDTYGANAPQVVVSCPPEVSTDLNTSRLSFGAGTPAEFTQAIARPVELAGESILGAVAAGQRLHLFERIQRIMARFYGFFPSRIDDLVLRSVKKNTIHPRALARL